MPAIDRHVDIRQVLNRLKQAAGSHSPSVETILRELPQVKLRIDACFLANPYATDLFLRYLQAEVVDTPRLRRLIEHYPSQNSTVARLVAQRLGVDSTSIFLGNGATEIIQAILHNFCQTGLLINLPTFSPFYEFVRPGTRVIYHQLSKESAFRFDPVTYLALVKQQKPDTVVLINPNNPDGGYLPRSAMYALLQDMRTVPNVIIDESFVHFAFEDEQLAPLSFTALTSEFTNLMIIKSMSKDFGIAGVRAGYAIMAPAKVQQLLSNGYLWNISGLAEYFWQLWCNDAFLQEYEPLRVRYIRETQALIDALRAIDGIHVYPSKANFVLIELVNGMTAFDFVTQLLIQHGIYTRDCGDKKGLVGEFVRIGARTSAENAQIVQAIAELCQQAQQLKAATHTTLASDPQLLPMR